MIDVLHIDGDHDYQAVLMDINKYISFLNKHGIVIFDDYDDAHPGVKKAVHEMLVEYDDLSIVSVNNNTCEYGSICIRRS
jgi:hypothetical protein